MGVDVRGSSPGTRETDRLGPTGTLRRNHALLLTGGSAFGLAAAEGVVRFLEERGVGLDVGVARIPLVSAAVLFDLVVGSPEARPDPVMGYEAARSAKSGDFAQGGVGAGTGATVGKVLGMERAMKGGLGSASVGLDGGLVVAALAAVNAFGDIRDPGSGEVLAGPRLEDGTIGDTVELLPEAASRLRWTENTTLGIVATNAGLSKSGANKVAQMAHHGLARVVHPVHTSVDGDVVFAASVSAIDTATDIVGAWGARVMQEAILRAVRAAEGVPGIPSASEYRSKG
jgi:L-aminopeptidase/D-esterase-like protein